MPFQYFQKLCTSLHVPKASRSSCLLGLPCERPLASQKVKLAPKGKRMDGGMSFEPEGDRRSSLLLSLLVTPSAPSSPLALSSSSSTPPLAVGVESAAETGDPAERPRPAPLCGRATSATSARLAVPSAAVQIPPSSWSGLTSSPAAFEPRPKRAAFGLRLPARNASRLPLLVSSTMAGRQPHRQAHTASTGRIGAQGASARVAGMHHTPA
mmetsp:Transcript_136660/g.262618  ORF Transcript_136660/g.262618 Transcript_136660/m.262618 type:complete len:211 (+) Transcript_136660:590-1222(+)